MIGIAIRVFRQTSTLTVTNQTFTCDTFICDSVSLKECFNYIDMYVSTGMCLWRSVLTDNCFLVLFLLYLVDMFCYLVYCKLSLTSVLWKDFK